MNRRETVLALLALCAVPVDTEAQQPVKIPRIGFLSLSANNTQPTADAFRRGLRELGYVEGKNVAVEWRSADGRVERLFELAMELAQMKVDVIVTAGTPSISAAQRATATIPIVMASSGDPVASGFVKSLARPGGNITGLSIVSADVASKELELLATMVPKLARVAYLINPSNQVSGAIYDGLHVVAQKVGIDVRRVDARSAVEIEAAFATMKKQKAQALIVSADALFILDRQRVASQAAKHRLPSIASFEEYLDAGGLMSYGANRPELWRHAAVYVDKILKGAKPSDLPVEQPTRIELAVNARAAKAMGIAIPKSILLRADRVIE